MRVGIDLRAMQVGHELRGIGEVLRHACRQLDARLPAHHVIVGFHDAPGPPVGALLASLFGSGRATSLVDLPPAAVRWERLRDTVSPAQAAAMAASCDVLLQFDPLLGVPPGVPTVVVVHDQIPLLLGDRYPETYWPRYGAARRRGLPRRAAAERAARRWLYERNLTRALVRAHHVVANSHHTERTTLAFAADHGITDLASRLSVARLGHDPRTEGDADVRGPNVMERARFEALGLDRTPFVLYLGGVDDRRRIDLLVAAFNDLRARGVDLKLVLAGDSFATIDAIGVARTRDAVRRSSYGHDLHLLGYVSPAERAWLYERAEAFAFPSEHEGFGLPVLEALAAGCAVVAFDNTAVAEVAGPNSELVAPDWPALASGIEHLLHRSPETKAADAEAGRVWASGFTWDTLGQELADRIATVTPSAGPTSG